VSICSVSAENKGKRRSFVEVGKRRNVIHGDVRRA